MKPYNFFGDYLREKYGTRILKVSINADLTCPNRDGKLGTRGCIFCCEDGSASPTTKGTSDIKKQISQAKESFKRADSKTRYLAYFQAFTNTYAPVKKLKKIYDTALDDPDVIGLMIGTRPDCLSDEILDMITGYKDKELWLEIGMQSIHEKSLKFLRRAHTQEDTKSALERAHVRGIKTCVHSIIGIPGESWEEIMETARWVSAMPVSGIKFHQLHVIKGTDLEKYYRDHKFSLLNLKEYVSIICDFIERLPESVLIHRLVADKDEKELIAPLWGHHKGTVIRDIENEFFRRKTHQGFLYGTTL